jgi:hypothetical protein
LLGLFVLVYLVGEGLIYFFYGREAALMGLICLLGTLVPVGLIVAALAILDWILKRANPD